MSAPWCAAADAPARAGRFRAGLLVAAVAGIVASASLLAASPAAAVSNGVFSIVSTDEDAGIVIASGSGAATGQFVVENLEAQPLTIRLSVVPPLLASTSTPGRASPSPTEAAFLNEIHLPLAVVALKPHQKKTLTVTVERPSGAHPRRSAAIRAVVRSPAELRAHADPLSLPITLDATVAVTATTSDAGRVATLSIAGALILVVLLFGVYVVRRRRVIART